MNGFCLKKDVTIQSIGLNCSVALFCVHVCADCPYHSELGGDKSGVLHSGVESQEAIWEPAEQHRLKRSVGVELQRVKREEKEVRHMNDVVAHEVQSHAWDNV